jgi:hypothetical protein
MLLLLLLVLLMMTALMLPAWQLLLHHMGHRCLFQLLVY